MISVEEFSKILDILEKRYSIEFPQHISEDPFKILIGTILSQRTRDEITDKAYETLFDRFPTIESLAKASIKEIEKLIRPVGFYKVKAKRIKEVARIILEKYSGIVPKDRDELLKLPGVGDKTADIVLSFGYGLPEIAVDTHVETVAKRLGIADEEDKYVQIKRKLEDLTPLHKRSMINSLFVMFGKEICRKPRPRCSVCQIKNFCKYYRSITQSKVTRY
ncbi:MAG: endonuclease III [Aigarchaeota archaeon]|nr:endonuclease III [Aigarchaeota archaeon]MCX8193184.1 endonuclease III [Nitrososphaeria archaeon]MDW7986325.1 endonuclease III [Nitrososphaerota archaeon]